jgi:hypothetical protein
MTTPTAAISLTQIAKLADLDPSFFSRHADELPPATPLRTGGPGRPQLAYNVDDLAALIVERTGHLSEAICRLRLALGAGPLRIVTTDDGRCHVVYDSERLEDLPDSIRTAVLDQVKSERANNTARRSRRQQELQQ